VLTFGRFLAGQFRYVEANGSVQIDPKSALGILRSGSCREAPTFGRAATFYVTAGRLQAPNRLFIPPEFEGRSSSNLASRGYEIGNHTLWHANLAKVPGGDGACSGGEAQVWIRPRSDYKTRTIGSRRRLSTDVNWVLNGSAQGARPTVTTPVLMVAGGPAPSPFSRAFDPVRLAPYPAVRARACLLDRLLDKNPANASSATATRARSPPGRPPRPSPREIKPALESRRTLGAKRTLATGAR